MPSPYRVLNWTLLPLLRWRISRIEGLENLPQSGGYLVAANHQSWIDSAILAGALYDSIKKSIRFVAQSSKYRVLGGIPINEYDPSSVLDVARGYLRAGHPIVIFPEGNSNPHPHLRVGKTGAARLSMATGTPVVPIGIEGTRGVSALGSFAWFLQWWKPLTIEIGQPLALGHVPLADMTTEQMESATEKIMKAISELSGKPYRSDGEIAVRSSSFQRRLLQGVVLPMLRWRVKVSGMEYVPDKGPFIVAANHTSYFDPGSIMVALWNTKKIQPFFLTKGTIADTWHQLLGEQAWHVLGMLPIDNNDKAKVLRAAESHVRRGGVLGIFPEGTRNKPRINPDWQTKLLKGKTGVARLAMALGVPIVPAAIFSPDGIGIDQTIINVLKFWKPVRVTFGQPMIFGQQSEPSKETLGQVTSSVMQAIAKLRGMEYSH